MPWRGGLPKWRRLSRGVARITMVINVLVVHIVHAVCWLQVYTEVHVSECTQLLLSACRYRC